MTRYTSTMNIRTYIASLALVVCVLLFPFHVSAGGLSSGLFVDGVTASGESLVVSTTIAPTFLDATTSNGVTTVPYAKTIYVRASQSPYFEGQITSQSYTVPAGEITLTNNGLFPAPLSFPQSLLLPNVGYYFRLEIGDFFSNTVAYGSTTTLYGTTPANPNSSDDGFFTVTCSTSTGFTSTGTDVSIPCHIVSSSGNEQPYLKVAYGHEADGTNMLGGTVLNTVMDVFQENDFTVSLSNLTPNTSYVFKIVNGDNPLIAYTPGQTFTTAVVEGATNTPGAGNGSSSQGAMYGAEDDTNFNGPGYTNSLVKCNGTPTDPCRFADFMALVQRMINFILILMLPICAIIFAYIGFLFLTSGGSSETKSKAKGILLKTVIGLILVLAAWLIVKTIVVSLGLVPDAILLDVVQ